MRKVLRIFQNKKSYHNFSLLILTPKTNEGMGIRISNLILPNVEFRYGKYPDQNHRIPGCSYFRNIVSKALVFSCLEFEIEEFQLCIMYCTIFGGFNSSGRYGIE